jgi:fatty acid desaturase
MILVLNSSLLVGSLVVSWALLWASCHLPFAYAALAVFAFAHINNLPFSMMHEAVHGIAAPSRRFNDWLGRIAGWAFPTSFSMQRLAHMGHHARNRTDLELYDYYLPGQSRLVRNIWLYAGNLFGLYWWSVVFGNVLYLLAPWAYRSRLFVTKVAPALGFGPYVEELVKLDPVRVWSEILLAFGYQAAIYYLLDLSLTGFLLCHVAFALHWSVLQYADHAWSARDVLSGAWNLRVLTPFRWIALNYHYHLAHHQHPNIPWYELPRWVDPHVAQPSFWRVYFSLWKGVRPAPPMGAPADLNFLFPTNKPDN